MWGVIVVKCRDVMNEGCTPTRLHDVTFRMTELLSLRQVNMKYPAVTWQEGMIRICMYNSSANKSALVLVLVHLRN